MIDLRSDQAHFDLGVKSKRKNKSKSSALGWVRKFGMWRQEATEAKEKDQPMQDLLDLYVPSVSYAIELLERMTADDRAAVLKRFE
jgi:hypothetical protein